MGKCNRRLDQVKEIGSTSKNTIKNKYKKSELIQIQSASAGMVRKYNRRLDQANIKDGEYKQSDEQTEQGLKAQKCRDRVKCDDRV